MPGKPLHEASIAIATGMSTIATGMSTTITGTIPTFKVQRRRTSVPNVQLELAKKAVQWYYYVGLFSHYVERR